VKIVARVDAWCRSGDLTVDDIAWFRIIFSTGLLLTLQPFGSLSVRPPERFDPPLGPFMLFDTLPSHGALEALEVLIAVLAGFLLVGLHTRTVSIVLALALMTGFGLSYSFGKIDHTIVLVLVPAVMAFSAWGDARSVDADRRPRDVDQREVEQWPMRFLAVLIALSFATAGWAKLRSGWLDLDSHAVQGHFVRSYYTNDRTDWLAPEVVHVHLGPMWELADWFTVALELGLVVAVVWWRLFRVAISVAALFHVGILMLLNIVFSWNILGYAAFVRWGSIVRWEPRARLRRIWGYVVALPAGAGAYVLHEWAGPELQRGSRTTLIFLGGAAGAIYLVVQVGRLFRARQPARISQ
jgi:uncharacterized membrane protein YphA (DoxX/SURF4 family)